MQQQKEKTVTSNSNKMWRKKINMLYHEKKPQQQAIAVSKLTTNNTWQDNK